METVLARSRMYQVSYTEDWYVEGRTKPQLSITSDRKATGRSSLMVASDMDDHTEVQSMIFMQDAMNARVVLPFRHSYYDKHTFSRG